MWETVKANIYHFSRDTFTKSSTKASHSKLVAKDTNYRYTIGTYHILDYYETNNIAINNLRISLSSALFIIDVQYSHLNVFFGVDCVGVGVGVVN